MLGISNKIIEFAISNTKLNISKWLSFSILLTDHITHTKYCSKGLNTIDLNSFDGTTHCCSSVFLECLMVSFRMPFELSSNCTAQGVKLVSQTQRAWCILLFLFAVLLQLGNRDCPLPIPGALVVIGHGVRACREEKRTDKEKKSSLNQSSSDPALW